MVYSPQAYRRAALEDALSRAGDDVLRAHGCEVLPYVVRALGGGPRSFRPAGRRCGSPARRTWSWPRPCCRPAERVRATGSGGRQQPLREEQVMWVGDLEVGRAAGNGLHDEVAEPLDRARGVGSLEAGVQGGRVGRQQVLGAEGLRCLCRASRRDRSERVERIGRAGRSGCCRRVAGGGWGGAVGRGPSPGARGRRPRRHRRSRPPTGRARARRAGEPRRARRPRRARPPRRTARGGRGRRPRNGAWSHHRRPAGPRARAPRGAGPPRASRTSSGRTTTTKVTISGSCAAQWSDQARTERDRPAAGTPC